MSVGISMLFTKEKRYSLKQCSKLHGVSYTIIVGIVVKHNCGERLHRLHEASHFNAGVVLRS